MHTTLDEAQRRLLPTEVDSTILDSLGSCPHKAAVTYFGALKPGAPSVHLHAGGALAHGLELARRAYYEDGLSAAEARSIGADAVAEFYGDFDDTDLHGTAANKTKDRTVGGFNYYLDHFPLQTDEYVPTHLGGGRRGIEVTFSVPAVVQHPDTNQRWQIVGRFDMLADFHGQLWIVDEKTTSRLGASWASQFATRFQFLTYCWAMQQMGYQVVGANIRGLAFYNNGYAVLEAPHMYTPQLLVRYELDLIRRLRMINQLYMQYGTEWSTWPRMFGNPCTDYGGCELRLACTSTNPTDYLDSLTIRPWSPLPDEQRGDVLQGVAAN